MNSQNLKEKILDINNHLRKRVLLYAQASLPRSQYEAYRKLILDLFGKSGAEGKIEEIFNDKG